MIINYQVPRLGMVSIELYKLAEFTYQLLDKTGHIERMRRNPQLGVIRGVCEGAHHTRWEYVVTQLYLINKLKESKIKTGLSNDKPRIRNISVSGAEILQIWILLFNAGHLLGTFSNERGLLMSIGTDKKISQAIRAGLPADQDIKQFFTKIVNKEDMYRLHEILAFFLLERLKRRCKKEILLLEDILKLYRFEPSQGGERRRKLKNLFLRIRQAAYLYLDSNYSPVPIRFEIGPILFNFDHYIPSLFSLDQSPLSKSLESFENMIVDTFYLSSASLYALGCQSTDMSKYLNGLNDNKKKVAQLYKVLFFHPDVSIKTWQKNSEHLLRLWIDLRQEFQPAIKEIKPIELESKWNARLPSSRCNCTIETDPRKTVLGINLAFTDDMPNGVYPRLFVTIVSLFMQLQDEFSNIQQDRRGTFNEKTFMSSCKELLLFILNRLWGKNVTFLPNQHTLHPDFWLMKRGSTKSSDELVDITKNLETRGMDPDRLHEIKTLAGALKQIRHRGIVLLTTGQIIVRKVTDNSDVTDLDGVAVCVDSGEFSLLLVESKNTRVGGVSAAKKRLRDTLTAMGILEPEHPVIDELTGYGAYTRVCLYKHRVHPSVDEEHIPALDAEREVSEDIG